MKKILIVSLIVGIILISVGIEVFCYSIGYAMDTTSRGVIHSTIGFGLLLVLFRFKR